jgi:outer membrane lipoprotein LolB
VKKKTLTIHSPTPGNTARPITDLTPLTPIQQLQKLNEWAISAKVNVERRGEHFSTAYLNWLAKKNSYQIDITSPAGIGHLQIINNAEGIIATTTQSDGTSKRYQVSNINEFINKLSGLALPVGQLQYWIKGIPAPQHSYGDEKYDANNHLIAINQQDWKVEWDRFKTEKGIALPHKIKATQQRGGTLKVTLIIAEWKI